MINIDEEIGSFTRTLPTSSEETLRAYASDLRIFRSWIVQENLRLEDIRPRDVRTYIRWLSFQRHNFKSGAAGLSPASVNRRVACLKSFFEYLIEQELFLHPNPVRKRHFLKIPERLPKPIDDTEVESFLFGIQKRLLFWCKKLGLKGVHLHRLRHTYATRLVKNGMRLEHLSELMGHSNINTTKKYTLISPAAVRDAYLSSVKT